MFKQLFSILLIASLVGPYLGISLYLKQEKKAIRREIKHRIIEGIDKSELVKLSFTEKEAAEKLHWEHSKEFEYRGEMYDVVETEKLNGVITYWCWWDNEETSLNKRLKSLLAIAMHEQNPKAPTKNAVNWLNLIFLAPEVPLFLWENSIKSNDPIFSKTSTFLSFIPERASPPPRS